MATMAQFRRDLKDNIQTMEVIEYLHGDHKYLNIKREVGKVQSNGFYLKHEGKSSYMDLPKSTLFEYDGEIVKFYIAGHRALTVDEQKVMDEWKSIEETPEHVRQAHIDMISDGSQTFYEKKNFFETRDMEHLLGYRTSRGMAYDFNNGLIRDEKVKGALMLAYRVERR